MDAWHPFGAWKDPVSCYQVGKPSTEDRSLFFDRLIEAALSVVVEDVAKKSQGSAPLPELPEAQKVASGPKASELKAKIEAEQHALRRMRMCLEIFATGKTIVPVL
ncbi:hypothetical protein NC652_037603 [Populus alba x Populus x berolinensis]|nr:hypothetical protein NC652_037603 [Populus alba x Populus x berolinensis]